MRHGQIDGGAVTPEMQAQWLAKWAHLIGQVDGDKYYVYDSEPVANELKDVAFRVIFADGKPVQVMKMEKKAAETIVGNANLKFGDF